VPGREFRPSLSYPGPVAKAAETSAASRQAGVGGLRGLMAQSALAGAGDETHEHAATVCEQFGSALCAHTETYRLIGAHSSSWGGQADECTDHQFWSLA
jgi:hypothetical protein